MSDDVFAVRTTFADVAELGQGYMERADGERILLPLPSELTEGEGVRFIVYLADGTPAFAGAGRAAQVSDQGTEAAPEERYETLIDGLVFDERSRPVYDYIVAVRQMAYADLGAAAEAQAAAGDEAVLESDDPAAYTDASTTVSRATTARSVADTAIEEVRDAGGAMEAEIAISDVPPAGTPEPALDPSDLTPPSAMPPAFEEGFQANEPDTAEESFARLERESGPARVAAAAPALPPPDTLPPPASVVPLATGLLRRPAIAAHWQPAAPVRPQPRAGSGLFRYPPGALPVPARPPRPELDPAQRIQRAPAPIQH